MQKIATKKIVLGGSLLLPLLSVIYATYNYFTAPSPKVVIKEEAPIVKEETAEKPEEFLDALLTLCESMPDNLFARDIAKVIKSTKE